MSKAVLDNLRAERDQARDAAIALASSESFDPTDKSYTELEARASGLDSQIERLVGLLDAQKAADALDGKMSKATRSAEQESVETRESLGDTFVRSDVFAQYPGRGTSSRLEIEERALPTTLGGLAMPHQQVLVTAPEVPDPLLGAVTNIPVANNNIDYVYYAKVAGGAAVVAEGVAKPSGEWAPTTASAALENIAVWTQLTRQLMEDAPAVAAIINNELRRDVARKEASNASAALTAASAVIPDLAGPDGGGMVGAIRAGQIQVEALGYQANAFRINPADLVAIDIEAWNKAAGRSPYWGMVPIIDSGQVAGKTTVGDFATAVHRYFRSAISLYITDSHADTFISNVFTLLAERRSKTVVVRPGALVEVTADNVVGP